ncbi:MAG: hypothetical protein QUV35_08560 [Hydrogenophaga sp.]|uniref:hypothetical protein n=1 Tax=Hydrogenophaga sp. TaxID=1904254 RepID=UPI00260F9D85|nr:hypothetical protein [Hydrogenophaga sp.]MDM7942666.1 hypothetical protein [Hydrogenophaga sp.]
MPDSETLRQAALRSSWRRDHRVGRRRRWWRWAVWALLRYGLPLLLLAGTVTAVVIIALAHTLEN